MRLKDLWQQLLARGRRPGVGEPDNELDPARLTRLEETLGHNFQAPDLLWQALLHRSHGSVAGASRVQSNERLEFLGDAVLGLVVNARLYRDYPQTSEGDLTKMKSLLVCRDRLAEVALRLDLGSHIRMSFSEAATGGRGRASILADTVEAVIGAVFLDGGLPAAAIVIEQCLLADSGELLARKKEENFKSRLQEIIQARFKAPPRYRVTAVNGPDHARLFQVVVSFNGHVLGEGEGLNKKTAEQAAARQALNRLASSGELLQELASPPSG